MSDFTMPGDPAELRETMLAGLVRDGLAMTTLHPPEQLAESTDPEWREVKYLLIVT